jgi:hypothetical protein
LTGRICLLRRFSKVLRILINGMISWREKTAFPHWLGVTVSAPKSQREMHKQISFTRLVQAANSQSSTATSSTLDAGAMNSRSTDKDYNSQRNKRVRKVRLDLYNLHVDRRSEIEIWWLNVDH